MTAAREVRVTRSAYRTAVDALCDRDLSDESETLRLVTLAERIEGFRDLLVDVQQAADRARRLFIHDRRKGKPAELLWELQTAWQEAVSEVLSFEAALGLTDVRGNDLAVEVWKRMRSALPEDVRLVQSPAACAAADAQSKAGVVRRRPGPKPLGYVEDPDDILDVGALLSGRMLS